MIMIIIMDGVHFPSPILPLLLDCRADLTTGHKSILCPLSESISYAETGNGRMCMYMHAAQIG